MVQFAGTPNNIPKAGRGKAVCCGCLVFMQQGFPGRLCLLCQNYTQGFLSIIQQSIVLFHGGMV